MALVDWSASVSFEKPFPHTIIDGFLDQSTVARINAEWPQDEWMKESGKGQKKWSTTRLPPTAKSISDNFDVSKVEAITGIDGLFQDRQLFGAGLHCIPRGGFLKRHVDFNQHPKGWHRRVNCLIYLNQEWKDEWGGHLELGLNNPVKIAPVGGRCVIFETNDESWHGHPFELDCPEDVQRRSMALYFYTKEKPQFRPHTTIYRKDV